MTLNKILQISSILSEWICFIFSMTLYYKSLYLHNIKNIFYPLSLLPYISDFCKMLKTWKNK